MAYGTVKVDNITFDNGGSDQNVTVSGLYNSLTSGVSVTGTISGSVVIGSTSVSGTTVLGTTVTGTTVQGTNGTFTSLTGTTITGTTINGVTVAATTGSFTSLTGTTTSGTTANFVSGVFTTQVSGTTVTGTTSSFTSGNFTTLSGATATLTSGVLALGTATNPSLSFASDPNTGIYSPGADQVAISTNGTGRLFVDASGNVGLGTSSPTSRLTIKQANDADSSAGTALEANGNDSRLLTYFNTSQDAWITTATYGSTGAFKPLSFWTSDTRRLTIDAAGNVGIGTTTPGETLSILGSTSTVFVSVTKSGTDACGIGVDGAGNHIGSGGIFAFRVGGFTSSDEKARIDTSGRLLVGTSTARSTGTVVWRSQIEGAAEFTGLGITTNQNSTGGAYLSLAKSRGTVVGSNTIVQNDDGLGYILFSGADGTDADTQAAFIGCEVDGTPGANDMPGRLVFSVTPSGSATPVERMRINRLGETAMMCAANNFNLFISNASTAGTTFKLIDGKHGSATAYSGTTSFTVFTNGNVQNTNNSYGQISDIKLKENIVDASSQWDDLKAVRVRNFNFKEGQTHRQIGVIAQELEEVSPGLVFETPDRNEDGNETGEVTKGVNYSVLYMKAVKALQEAMERIEQLESSNADLLARVTALEAS
jgi:hypothetical protein